MINLIDKNDLDGIRKALKESPSLANEGIPLCEGDLRMAHPLHRLCDAVFAKKVSDEQAVKIAEILLENGSNVNGYDFVEKQDTPLIAAASLNAEKVGIFYIDRGADIAHAGCHGGTALHWAAWCGKDKLLARLLAEESVEIDRICIDHKATPIFWAIHGLKNGGKGNLHNQVECAKLLFAAGADTSIPNGGGDSLFSMLDENDTELLEILK